MTIQPFLTPSDLIREGVGYLREGVRRLDSLDFSTDEDYFLFFAESNRSYTILVDSAIDTMIGAYDLAGLELFAADDDSGPGATPQLSFTTQDAPLVIVFQVDASFSGEPGEAGLQAVLGSYSVLVRDDGPGFDPPPFGTDVIGDGFPTAAALLPETEVAGRVDFPGDFDFYAIWLEADREYDLSVLGLGGFDPFIELFDEDGLLIAANDDVRPGTTEAALTYAAGVSGLHYVAVSGSDLDFDVGNYSVLVDDRGAIEPPDAFDTIGDTIGSAALAEVGQTIAQSLEFFDDLDVYEISLAAGARYGFSVFGFDQSDPALSLLDDLGREIAFDDDSGPGLGARIDFAPRFDGLYYLEVSGSFGDPGPYDLVTELLRPEGALTLDARDIALLYEAGLGRPAQFEGLNFWIDRFEDTSLRSVAFAFLDSPEFTARVGDIDFISDFQLVTGLYENVLGRPGGQAGIDFWLDVFARPGVDEADLLIAFARSPENLAGSPYASDIEMVSAGDWDFV